LNGGQEASRGQAVTARQSTDTVLMIRPRHFGSNPETAVSNAFQVEQQASSARALAEFDELASKLTQAGVRTIVFEDTDEPVKPDAVFPNNWVSFHRDGRVVRYPMLAPSRRLERRQGLLDALHTEYGYEIREIIDLSGNENAGHFLEGTGSMVLDRVNRLAYVCLSPRTHLQVAAEFAQRMGYELVVFEAVDPGGMAIYHTNVMLCVGTRVAVICAEAIMDERARAAVLDRLRSSGHEVVELSLAQMVAFAGNMLELRGRGDKGLLVMSQRARESLRDEQVQVLERHLELLGVPVPHIEDCAGGSVRCMLAEVFLPHR